MGPSRLIAIGHLTGETTVIFRTQPSRRPDRVTQVILDRIQHKQRAAFTDHAELLRQQLHGLAIAARVRRQLLQARLRPQPRDQTAIGIGGTDTQLLPLPAIDAYPQRRWRSVSPRRQPQPALFQTATINHHIVQARGGCNVHGRRHGQQATSRRAHLVGFQLHQRAATGLAPATQACRVGTGHGAADGKQALICRQCRQRCWPPIAQAITEQQVLAKLRPGRPRRQRAGAIGGRLFQHTPQGAPIPLANAETTLRFRFVAQHRQHHAALAHRCEITVQQRELTCTVARARRAGGVPQQADP